MSHTHDPPQLASLSLSNVRQLASVLNRSFGQDPGTVFRGLQTKSGAILETDTFLQCTGSVYTLPSAIIEPDRYEREISALDGRRLSMLRRRLCDPGTYVVGATLDDEVAGVSMWIAPEGHPELQRPVPWYFRLLGYCYKAYDKLVSLLHVASVEQYFWPAWPGVRQRLAALQAVDREIQARVIPDDIRQQGYWTLALLGTSEKFARRGVGSSLLRWGCAKADETDRAVFMTASVKGEQLYLKHGFQVLRKELLFEKDEAAKGGIWQAYMMRYPKSQRKWDNEQATLAEGVGRCLGGKYFVASDEPVQ